MLGPNFEEGSRRASASAPASIRLPEDNAAAMEIFCRAIHYQINDISEPVTPTQLENLAVLCDKYDCVRALKPWTTLWFTAALEDYPSKDSCLKLLVAACALDDPHAFSMVSWEIVVTRQGPIRGLEKLTDHDLMPKTVLAEMDHRRSEIYLDISDAIEKPIEGLLNLSGELLGARNILMAFKAATHMVAGLAASTGYRMKANMKLLVCLMKGMTFDKLATEISVFLRNAIMIFRRQLMDS
ncbi:MAG: hypothetical protein Q9191_003978 [Dirinaria sp. TL-2023a]